MIGTPARPSSKDLPPWLVLGVLAVCWLTLLGGIPGSLSPTTLPWARYLRGPDMGGGVGGLLGTLRHPVNSYERPVSPTASNPVTERVNLNNGRGDIVAQSDPAGTLTWTASYEAYGKRTLELGSNADRQRANTKEEDPTGLLNEGFRYRDLETGVWLSRDPAGFVDGPNLYAYVKQNPWTGWDPDGLESQSERDWQAKANAASMAGNRGEAFYCKLRHAGAKLDPFNSDSTLREACREIGPRMDEAANKVSNSDVPFPFKSMAMFSLGVGGAGAQMNPFMASAGLAETAKNVKEKGAFYVLKSMANSIGNDAVNHPEKLAGNLLTIWAGGSATGKLVSAPKTGRVLWTGGDKAQEAAIQFAQQTGGRTLEMTCTGKLLSELQRVTGYEPIKGLWDRASQNFARGAQGPVNVFMNPEMAHAGSTFARKELPELIKNGNTVNYNTVK